MGRQQNQFIEKETYMIGTTSSGVEFMFDKSDYELIKGHCWFVDNKGYIRSKINYKKVAIHRYLLNPDSNMVVDHINHNTLDNRRKNIRICTRQQNQSNQLKQKIKTSSKYKGIHWDSSRKKWAASIQVNRNMIFLGRFESEKKAANAYNEAALRYFGEFAHINRLA